MVMSWLTTGYEEDDEIKKVFPFSLQSDILYMPLFFSR